MKSFTSLRIVLFSFVCLSLHRFTRGQNEPHACLEKLSVEDKKTGMAIMEACKKKVGLDQLPKMDELEKNGFDDKCFAKCKLMELKIMTDKGFDKTTLEEFTKKVSPDKQKEVLSLWQTCLDSTTKALAGEGGLNEKNSCKAAAMLKACFMKDVTKFC